MSEPRENKPNRAISLETPDYANLLTLHWVKEVMWSNSALMKRGSTPCGWRMGKNEYLLTIISSAISSVDLQRLSITSFYVLFNDEQFFTPPGRSLSEKAIQSSLTYFCIIFIPRHCSHCSLSLSPECSKCFFNFFFSSDYKKQLQNRTLTRPHQNLASWEDSMPLISSFVLTSLRGTRIWCHINSLSIP